MFWRVLTCQSFSALSNWLSYYVGYFCLKALNQTTCLGCWWVGDLFGLNKQLDHVCNCPLSHNHTLGYYWFEQHHRLWHSFIRILERIHLACMMFTVMTVMSSINSLLNGIHVSVFALVPLFASLILMFKPWRTVWQRWSIHMAIPFWSWWLWICCLRTSIFYHWSNS